MEFNLEKEIKCVCGIIYENDEFGKHIKKCEKFIETFSDFDSKISKLIKNYSNPKEQLLIIKFILNRYINILDIQIGGNFFEITKAFKDCFMKSFEDNKKIGHYNNDNESNKISDYKKIFYKNFFENKIIKSIN